MIRITDLDAIQKKLEKISGKREIPIENILSNSFMVKHTPFKSIDELFKSIGFEVQTEKDFKNIPPDKLDICVAKNTNFNNWKDMLTQATKEYYVKELDI